MKIKKKVAVGVAMFMCMVCVHAFEYEGAVPLSIGEMQRNISPSTINVSLIGKIVTVAAKIEGQSNDLTFNGYYAYTPLFHRLGEGEENYDKSFSDLRVTLGGKSVSVHSERRAFFLGSDITMKVRAVGLDPLPSETSDPAKVARIKPLLGVPLIDSRNWEGFASYSWVVPVPPGSSETMVIQYQALPQFSLESQTSPRFARLVQQHCGDVERIRSKLQGAGEHTDQVLVQRYIVPVSFIGRSIVRVEISQPDPDWLGARPALSLACGVTPTEGSRLPTVGDVDNLDGQLSVLIISNLLNN